MYLSERLKLLLQQSSLFINFNEPPCGGDGVVSSLSLKSDHLFKWRRIEKSLKFFEFFLSTIKKVRFVQLKAKRPRLLLRAYKLSPRFLNCRFLFSEGLHDGFRLPLYGGGRFRELTACLQFAVVLAKALGNPFYLCASFLIKPCSYDGGRIPARETGCAQIHHAPDCGGIEEFGSAALGDDAPPQAPPTKRGENGAAVPAVGNPAFGGQT